MKARTKAKRASTLPGYEGRVLHETKVKITGTRSEVRSIRSRPGSFEWRYNRDDRDLTPLYHGGIKYAELWEKAGTASAIAANMEFVSNGGWKGMPDGRMAALDDLREIFPKLGQATTARLTAYCVHGNTVSEIAARFGVPPRDMAAVIHQDLHACAIAFRLLR